MTRRLFEEGRMARSAWRTRDETTSPSVLAIGVRRCTFGLLGWRSGRMLVSLPQQPADLQAGPRLSGKDARSAVSTRLSSSGSPHASRQRERTGHG